MRREVLLGLDLGTTNCKVIAIDLQGLVLAQASSPTPSRPSPDQRYFDYDAEELWAVFVHLLQKVQAKLDSQDRVVALCSASMGEAGVLVDAQGTALTPVLPWNDRRTIPFTAWLRERIDPQAAYAITGLRLDHMFTLPKLLWLRQAYPQAFARAHTWLGLADWLAFKLTGARLTSHTLASRTLLFDVGRRCWSQEMLSLAELPAALLPTAVPSGTVIGQVTSLAARLTGLQPGLPLAAGGHDHLCAALAAGVVQAGPILDSSGTAESILVSLEAPRLDSATAATGLGCGCHSARGRYYLGSGVSTGGVIAWAGRLLFNETGPEATLALMRAAAQSPPRAHGVTFLPYLEGSGPPQRDPSVAGAWQGLRLQHTRVDLARAVVEGACYAVRFVVELTLEQAGAPGDELRCVGGGARNPLWQQIKANVTGLPVEVPQVNDLSALGAALLAGLAISVFPDELTASCLAYHTDARYEPQADHQAIYAQGYQEFLATRARNL